MENKNYGQSYGWGNYAQQGSPDMYAVGQMNPMSSVAEMSQMPQMPRQYSYEPANSYNGSQEWASNGSGSYRESPYGSNGSQCNSISMQRMYKASQSRNGLNSPMMQRSHGGSGGEEYYSYNSGYGGQGQNMDSSGKQYYY